MPEMVGLTASRTVIVTSAPACGMVTGLAHTPLVKLAAAEGLMMRIVSVSMAGPA